jgi:hypothetical protein
MVGAIETLEPRPCVRQAYAASLDTSALDDASLDAQSFTARLFSAQRFPAPSVSAVSAAVHAVPHSCAIVSIIPHFQHEVTIVAANTDRDVSRRRTAADRVMNGVLDERLQHEMRHAGIERRGLDPPVEMQPRSEAHLFDVDVVIEQTQLLVERLLIFHQYLSYKGSYNANIFLKTF